MSGVAYEVNFDGIVGPTHNYGGLSYGNVASMQNRKAISSPNQRRFRAGEDEVMADWASSRRSPAHERPHLPTLRRWCMRGATDNLEKVAKGDRGAVSRRQRLGDVGGERRDRLTVADTEMVAFTSRPPT